jgi:hypothetical protein
LAFSSSGGNPRFVRISIRGVSFHKPLRFASFCVFLFMAILHEKFRVRKLQERRQRCRSTYSIPHFLSGAAFSQSHSDEGKIGSSSCPFQGLLGQAGFQARPIRLALDHQIVRVAGKAIDGALRPNGIGKRGQPFIRATI